MDVRYFDWSSITVQRQQTVIGFDLFGRAVTWAALDPAATKILCVTHGHPEHCGSLRSFLSAPAGRSGLASTHVISSPPVIDYVTASTGLTIDHAHCVAANEAVSINGTRITAFEWKHMPLLPPGPRAKASFFAHVLLHPISLMRIGVSGLRLPMNAPMLGFHVKFADGFSVLNYSEGLHRLTDPLEVESIARHWLPADVLLFAVEPDDVEVLPRWLEILQPKSVVIYEAHRPWREIFHLPSVELLAYSQVLAARFPQVRCVPLISGGEIIGLV
jgi:hypothetical protein